MYTGSVFRVGPRWWCILVILDFAGVSQQARRHFLGWNFEALLLFTHIPQLGGDYFGRVKIESKCKMSDFASVKVRGIA